MLGAEVGPAMECPHCRREMIIGASVCHHCGKRLPRSWMEQISRLGGLVFMLAAVAIAAMVIVRLLEGGGL